MPSTPVGCGPFEFRLPDRRFKPATAIVLVSCLCAITFCSRHHPAPAVAVSTAVIKPDTIPAPKILTHIVKRGDTFVGVLKDLGIDKTKANAYYRSLKPIGLSSIFPGDSVQIRFKSDENVDTLSLLNRLETWFRLVPTAQNIAVSRTPVVVSTYRCMVHGRLEHSLSEDMIERGVGDALVGKFTDIFAWDINFFTDPRTGDRFEAIFEKKYAEGQFTGYGEILAARYVAATGHEHYAIGLREGNGPLVYYDLQGNALQKQFLKAPLRFSRISSRFSYNRLHPVLGIVRPHLGVDYAAPPGTPVYASADGSIAMAGWDNGYGNFVKINHGAAYQTLYGHMQALAGGIRKGRAVRQGELIGWVGSTGLATGPHLDYRMMTGGRYVNPLTVSLPSKSSVAAVDRPRFDALAHSCVAALDSRFPGSDGYWVIDIRINGPADTAQRFVASNTAGYGRKPGS